MKAVLMMIGLLSFVPSALMAESIPMLPPMQDVGVSDDVCLKKEGAKVLTWDGETAIKCNEDVVVKKGDVGIGTKSPASKLDVSGGVKVGSDMSACTNAKAGTLRFVGQKMQYCDGTEWRTMGSRLKTTKYRVFWDLPPGTPSAAITRTVRCPSGQMTYCNLTRRDGEIACPSSPVVSDDSCTVTATCNTMVPGGPWAINYICAEIE